MQIKQLHPYILIAFILLWSTNFVTAQIDSESQTEQIIADIYEQISEDSEDEIDFTTFFEDLFAFTQTPINLNNTTKEELERLQFLSDLQIENILYFVHRYGKMQTIYELQLIDGLSDYEIRNLLPFIYVGDRVEKQKIYWRDVFKHGKNELLLRIDRGVETKEGYRFYPEEDEQGNITEQKNYLGDPFYTSLKYHFNYSNKIQFGLSAEKDAGEQFWGSYNKGYDFYSGYLQLNDIWKFKTIVAGDFRANFGQGLVLKPEFGFGKSSYVLNVAARNTGLKKFSSTDEYNFFRGGGATIKLGNFDITAFYSNKMLDATVENGTFASITKTGLHRTESEMTKKHTVNQQIMGGNVTFNYKNLQVGFTAVNTILSDTLVPTPTAYSNGYFSGTQQFVGGLHYRLRVGKFSIFGETAMADNLAMATINGISFSPISQVGLVAMHRYYSPNFDNFYATAFGETSRINNEQGLYLGAEVRPFRKWKFAAYADGYAFMMPKYGIDVPSTGFDYMLQADFVPQRTMSMYWRLKWEQKSANISGTSNTTPTVGITNKASARYYLTYSYGQFSFKNILEVNLAKPETEEPTFGFIVSQDVSYKINKVPITIDVRFQIFDAQDYENRFYSYEKDVLYAFSIPMYYGLGGRYYLNLKYDINRHFSIWLKAAQTVYADDRETLSSSNEEIVGNRKTDLRLMVRWKF